ncbi:MAG: HD domain-containing protein [Paracoccaceae bacterium]
MTIKTIKDPIHGFIDFEGDFENELRQLLDDPFFLRLRKVKQLGFSDHIFPSATHTRFSHSLGVYCVARRMLGIVEPEAGPDNWSKKGKACLAAALLHDVGHGMFSHAFEGAMKNFLEETTLSEGKDSALRAAVSHEKISERIIMESSVADTLKGIGGEEFPKLVSDMVRGKDKTCIYTSIVSSQLDADRLDYILRDPYFAGVSSGRIDIDWILKNLRYSDVGNLFYFDSKAYISMEQFAVSLFQLYPTIYFHKKTRALENMFSKMLCRIFELISDGKSSDAGISKNHPFAQFFSDPSSLDNSLLLDDTVLWGSMYQFRSCDDESVRNLAIAISNRKIDKMVDLWRLADEFYSELGLESKYTAKSRVEILNEICPMAFEKLCEKHLDWKPHLFYDNYSRKVYSPASSGKGSPQQININIGGNFVDIFDMSPIVASSASFHIHRLYFDPDRFTEVAELKAALRETLKDALFKLKFPTDKAAEPS